ncbi:oral-facial-digital syndrome 1 protein [Arapaima gigas]
MTRDVIYTKIIAANPADLQVLVLAHKKKSSFIGAVGVKMSVAREEAISLEEMRKRLYQTFKNRGVLDTLKTQLRNQLIHELKDPAFRGDVPLGAHQSEPDSIMVTAANSLVADHLRRAGYEYTQSVFYPESGMGKDKLFSTRDVLQLLKISPRCSLYKSLVSFLMTLLSELTDHHLRSEHSDANTQTDSTPQYRESLDKKMQMIEDEYAALCHQGNKLESLEVKLSEYKRDIETQLQVEMDAKLQHFKEVELAKVKLEEKEKSHRELLELKRNMEKTYEMKSEGLINREKNAIERLQKQQEIEEKEIYVQRQSLLKEIEAVRNREAELRQRIEAFEKSCKLQEDKTRSTEELLKRRELSVKILEDTYDLRLKSELKRYQLELKEEFLKRTKKVTEEEERNKVETLRLQKDRASIEAMAEEHRQACATVTCLQAELNGALSEVSLLKQQNEVLKERLETMSEYPNLKMEKVELQAQLRLIRRQLEEAQEENRQLQTEMSKPSKEQLALQVELRKLEAAKKFKEEEFESQKQILQIQLRSEVERCAQLKAQLTECQERTQRMTTHAEEIKQQLRQTQLALENEVLRNPKPSLVNRSALDLVSDKIVLPDIYVDGPVLKSWGDRNSEHEADMLTHKPWQRRPRSSSPDSDVELLVSARARIQELEKEAEYVEEAYRNYQQRVAREAASNLRSPRSLTPQWENYTLRTKVTAGTQPRVTFTPDELPKPSLFAGFVSAKHLESVDFNERTPGEHTPPDSIGPPPRRLSSTPLSIAKRQLSRDPNKDAEASPVTFQGLSPRQLSPIPRMEPTSSAGLTVGLSPPSSPPLRSTTRELRRFPEVRQDLSSSGSSPQPEKITLGDLTEPEREPGRIPELHQDEVDCPSSVAPKHHSITPEEGPECSPHQKPSAEWSSAEAAQQREAEDEEERRWELERQAREKRRQQERQEALEREQRELEQLEQERLLKEMQQPHCEEEDGIDCVVRNTAPETRSDRQEPTEEPRVDAEKTPSKEGPPIDMDPLQQYMRMVMQGSQASPQQSSKEEDAEERSLEAEILLTDKDDSIVAFPQEDAEDDFW